MLLFALPHLGPKKQKESRYALPRRFVFQTPITDTGSRVQRRVVELLQFISRTFWDSVTALSRLSNSCDTSLCGFHIFFAITP